MAERFSAGRKVERKKTQNLAAAPSNLLGWEDAARSETRGLRKRSVYSVAHREEKILGPETQV
jgi:hypothetical protein